MEAFSPVIFSRYHLTAVEWPLFKSLEDLSGGTVDWNLPAHAGACGFNLWFRKFPHAMGQLRLYTTTTEPERHNC